MLFAMNTDNIRSLTESWFRDTEVIKELGNKHVKIIELKTFS